MPLHSLPDECFCNVLSFLVDNQSLYKCLFVSRYWCKLSIPIFWREPFKPSFIYKKFSLIINTLLACLDEDEISSLIPYKIDFPNDRSTLFEYGRFIRNIDQDSVIQNIITWLNPSAIPTEMYDIAKHQDCRVPKLISVIYRMIIRQGSNLQEFSLSNSYTDLPKFFVFANYKPGITNLRSLEIDINNYDMRCQNIIEFLSMVPTLCNNITNCDIFINESNTPFVKSLWNIVKSQPLKRTLIYADNVEEDTKKIIYALEFRSKTLKKLLFDSIDFQAIDLSFMSKLECLEQLKFIQCKGFVSRHCEVLSESKFQLKELKLWHSGFYDEINGINGLGIDLNVTERIINILCGENLLKLTLNIVTPNIIKTIKNSCPNLTFLFIKIFSGKSLESIIQPICELSSLKILNIKVYYYYGIDNGLLVKILSDYLTSVEYLLLDFHIDLLSFEYFTKNCKANLKKWITFNNEYSRKDYLLYVINYQKIHNSLKIFGIEDIHRFSWTNEELTILDSLNDQGVEIVSSFELLDLFY